MVTVNKAIIRGQLLVNAPVLLIMMGLIGASMYLATSNIIPWYFVPGSILIGPGIAWIYWGFAITKWRIWALTNVEDHFELKQSAIEGGLIWEDGSFFERTEIRTPKERKLIHELEQRYRSKKEKQKFKDDLTIPDVTEIQYSKVDLVSGIILMSVCCAVGAYLLLWSDNWVYGLALTVIGLVFSIKGFMKIKTGTSPLVLGNFGIRIKGNQYGWEQISGEKTAMEGFGKHRNSYLIFWVGPELVKTNIDDCNTTLADLRNKLKIYRGRYQKRITANMVDGRKT